MILEKTEWTHTWWEQAPTTEGPRVLLIGDSISVGYRSLVNKKLGGELLVTSHATSKALDNPYFFEELALTAKQGGYDYRILHFNNGLHGFHLDADAYRMWYEKAILTLREMFPSAKLTLALSTPVIPRADAEGKRESGVCEKEEIVRVRNDIVRELAARYDLAVDDLYTPVCGREELKRPDGTHFEAAGSELLSDVIVDFLLQNKE